MGSFGPTEMIILLVIVLLLFGAKKLPELSKSLGTSIKEFRKATDDEEESDEQPRATVTPPTRED